MTNANCSNVGASLKFDPQFLYLVEKCKPFWPFPKKISQACKEVFACENNVLKFINCEKHKKHVHIVLRISRAIRTALFL